MRESQLRLLKMTGATRSGFIKYGLAFIAALIGFAVAGSLGFALGVAFGLLGPMVWEACRNSRNFQTERPKTSCGEIADTMYKAPFVSGVLAMFLLGLLLFIYGLALGLGHNRRADGEWIRIVQPAIDRLSTFVPALRRMPYDLIERGQADWAPAVQQVLFAGWLFLLLIGAWVIFEVLVINRHFWARMRPLLNRRGWVTMILICIGAVLALGPVLFFGWTAPGWGGFAGVVGLPMLAGCFFVITATFFVLALACNALAAWPRVGVGGATDEQAMTVDPFLLDLLRRLVPAWMLGRMFEVKSDGG